MTAELVINAAFLVATGAFLVRDILRLRLLAALAYTGLLCGALLRPLWPGAPHLYWYALFAAINAAHGGFLLYQRNLLRLSADEEGVRAAAFPALDAWAVKRILREGTWIDFVSGEALAREGQLPERLLVLARGHASVTLEGRPVAELDPGDFVGEIAFLTGRPATATVAARGPLRCLAWPRQELAEWLRRDPQLQAVLQAAVGKGLSAKIEAANLAIAGGSA